MKQNKLCLFDVVGTLFDTGALDPYFATHFGKKEARQIWFKTVLHTALTNTLTDEYKPFAIIAEQTLESLGEQWGIKIGKAEKAALKETMQALPVHADVRAGIERLKAEGYRIAALTNSSEKTARGLLKRAGIETLFENVLSTDSVERFKPAPEPYLKGATELSSSPQDIWLIASHAWDITGAAHVGMKTALIKRSGHGFNHCFAKPTVHGKDLLVVAAAIAENDKSLLSRLKDIAHKGQARPRTVQRRKRDAA